MKINTINTDDHVLIIAEIGNNHEGDFTLAQELIGRAAEAGADAVKFQTIVPEKLVSSPYTQRIEQLRRYQFTPSQFAALAQQAEAVGVLFFSTPFDLESARFLNTIQSVFKIASGDNTFYPLIDTVAHFAKPMLVSTGLARLGDVHNLHGRINAIWRDRGVMPGLALLHCVASYPVPMEHAHLGTIATLARHFPDAVIGYSDHTLGIEAATYAVAAGARIIEKHFTIDNQYSAFRDHQLSANPEDFKRMVESIRRVEIWLGSGEQGLRPCEAENAVQIRRSIAAAQSLPLGTRLSDEHFTWLRPGTGLPPGSEAALRGRTVRRTVQPGELITAEDVGE